MAYATGTRIAAAVCFLSVIGTPFGIWLLWIAHKKEQERERELAALNNATQ